MALSQERLKIIIGVVLVCLPVFANGQVDISYDATTFGIGSSPDPDPTIGLIRWGMSLLLVVSVITAVSALTVLMITRARLTRFRNEHNHSSGAPEAVTKRRHMVRQNKSWLYLLGGITLAVVAGFITIALSFIMLVALLIFIGWYQHRMARALRTFDAQHPEARELLKKFPANEGFTNSDPGIVAAYQRLARRAQRCRWLSATAVIVTLLCLMGLAIIAFGNSATESVRS